MSSKQLKFRGIQKKNYNGLQNAKRIFPKMKCKHCSNQPWTEHSSGAYIFFFNSFVTKYSIEIMQIENWRFKQLFYSSQKDGFDAVSTEWASNIVVCFTNILDYIIVYMIKNLLNIVYTIFLCLCCAFISSFCSYVSIFQTNVALHKIL